MMRAMLATTATIAFVLVPAAQADVRVVHASPDAPAVDVLVNDGQPPAIEDLAFTDVTGYIPLPTGMYNFKVRPANSSGPDVIDVDAMIDGTKDYTIIASDVLANITPLVFVDDNKISFGSAKVRFIHLSPNAPAVDITLAGGSPTLFGNVSFQESGGYITVPAGTYDLEARVAGGGPVALSVPGVALEENTVYTIYAMGLLNDPTTPLQAVASVDAQADADVRVVHASPDAPAVDVLVNDGDPPAIEDLAFTDVTGYIGLPPATYNFKVRPANSTGPDVIDADVPLAAGTEYTVIASDVLANITPLVFEDDNQIIAGEARVRFIHLSPNAPAVDITVAGGTPVLFANVSFQESGGYITVPAGTYDLEARVAGGGPVALSVPGVMLEANTVYTIYAMGLLNDPTTPLQAVASVDNSALGFGDVNCDGIIHAADIDAFVMALVDPANYPSMYPNCDAMLADVNGDGAVNAGDIDPFVQLLTAK